MLGFKLASLEAIKLKWEEQKVMKIQRAALIAELESALSPDVAKEVQAIVRRITHSDDVRRISHHGDEFRRGTRAHSHGTPAQTHTHAPHTHTHAPPCDTHTPECPT